MLTLVENRSKTNVSASARRLVSKVIHTISKLAKKHNLILGEFIFEGGELFSKIVTDEYRVAVDTVPFPFEDHNLQVSKVSLYFFTEDAVDLWNHTELPADPQVLDTGSYDYEKFLDRKPGEAAGEFTARAVVVIPGAYDSVSHSTKRGRQLLSILHRTFKEILVHELIHAQQRIPVPDDDAPEQSTDEEVYMLEDDEIDAFTGQVKSNAVRLVKLIRKDRPRYLRIVDRIDDPVVRDIATDVDTLVQRDDRYEMMFKIALEVFLSDRDLSSTKPEFSQRLRSAYSKHFNRKYRGVNENLLESILVRLLHLSNT